MLEEAIRFIFSHPRLTEEPEIAAYGGMLVTAASCLAQWRCFTDNMVEGDFVRSTGSSATVTAAAGGGGGGSPSAKLCSSLLRLISLALTIAKAAARRPDSSEPCWSASFELWKTCSTAVHLFDLPQRMQAARGITALLLNPACCGIQRTMAMVALKDPPNQAVLSIDAVSSIEILLQSCCNSLPPRLAVDVLMAGPALSLVEQEAGRLPQRDPAGSGVSDFDCLTAPVADYISSLMMSLACAVFKVSPFGTQLRAGTFAQNKLSQWLSMALDPNGCREGYYSPQDGKPFFSAAFRSEAAPASAPPDLAEESVSALSRIMSSHVWDRVIGFRTTSAATTSGWLMLITSSLCCAASILELHPAVRQHSHMGSSTPGGGTADVAVAATVPASPPSGSIRVPSPSSQWQEARHSITGALHLFNSPYSRESQGALVRVLSVALGRLRDVLSGIIVSQAGAAVGGDGHRAAIGGDSLGGITAVPVVASENRSGGGLDIRDWECVQSELLLGLPEELWGIRPCCNTACVRLEGPCEMEIKTRVCGGGCGARYCCAACQEQAWRGGHRRNCVAMRKMR